MTDFSFYNRAYDLILSLKDDLSLHKKYEPVKSIGELRLMIDIVKIAYPLYENADNATIIDFIKDIFNCEASEIQMEVANRDEETWRPVQIIDIVPGAEFKINEGKYYYHQTFWAYADTGRVIPPEVTSADKYARSFLNIWEKAKQGKVLVKNTYLHRIGDKVFHRDDIPSSGIIKSRQCVIPFNPPSYQTYNTNCYMVTWSNTGNAGEEVPLKCWFDENELVNVTKLEAIMPEKTILKKGKRREVVKKVFNKEVFDRTVKFYNYNEEQAEQLRQKGEVGYTTVTTVYEPFKKKSGKERKRLREKSRLKRRRLKALNLAKNKYPEPQYMEKITPKSHPQEYNFRSIDSEKKQSSLIMNHPLVCIKHIPTGVVSRVRNNEAKLLVKKDGYDYATKLEWRKYLNEVRDNREKSKPGPTTIKHEVIFNSVTGESSDVPMNRSARRSHKQKIKRSNRNVKVQMVPVHIPQREEKVKSIKPTLTMYDEQNNPTKEFFEKTIIRPATTIFKKILIYTTPKHSEKLTDSIKEQRKERSDIDRVKYYNKKELKSREELMEQFASDERRGDKNSNVEKWSSTFNKMVNLIKKGWFEDKEYPHGKIFITKKAILQTVKTFVHEHHLTWDDNKIADFIRYIRLTVHGLRNGRETRPNPTSNYRKNLKKRKANLPVVHEPTKTAVRVDYTKLKADPNDPKNVIDEGGGFTDVTIKSRRVDPDHLKKYFQRIKEDKLPFKGEQKITKKERKKRELQEKIAKRRPNKKKNPVKFVFNNKTKKLEKVQS